MDDHVATAATNTEPKTTMNPLNALPYLLDTSIANGISALASACSPSD